MAAQPDRAIEESLRLPRYLSRPEFEAPVRCHHDYFQVLHLGIELQEASSLGKESAIEPRLGVLLHLKQNNRLLGGARFP